jgi:hypothetical protein
MFFDSSFRILHYISSFFVSFLLCLFFFVLYTLRVLSRLFRAVGKKIPRLPGVKYYVTSGVQECMMCRRIIDQADRYGHGFPELCSNEVVSAKPMCLAQQKVLASCPEFSQNWCYSDDGGGSQQLLSPCPAVLKCHYCLGLNPLHCVKRGEYGTYEGM